MKILKKQGMISLEYVDAEGNSKGYPFNPNGSTDNIAGICDRTGRIFGLMPHPERVFRTVAMSWHPADWPEDSPWMKLFYNARSWVG